MISNESVEKGSLPIISEESQVNSISMKLYTYLTSISTLDYSNPVSRKAGRRQFQQKDFTLAEIKRVLDLDPKTIKKYWEILEERGLITYDSRENYYDENDELLTWAKRFAARRKQPNGYYSITRPQKFRKIPKETIDKILSKFNVSEQELKIYILLANWQEYNYYNGGGAVYFTYKDLTSLLQIDNQTKNRMQISRSLQWLKGLGLINFEITSAKCGNFDQKIDCFKLKQVNFYTDGGSIGAKTNTEEGFLTTEIKEAILKGVKEQDIE